MKSQLLLAIFSGIMLAAGQEADADAKENPQPVDPAKAELMALLEKLGPRAKGMGVGVNDDWVPVPSIRMYENPDLSALRGLPVRNMQIMGSMDLLASGKVVDLAPLAGMPLETLWIWKVPLKDLSPLKSTRLKKLLILGSISDISPLKDLPLVDLSLWCTRVSDISPLKGMRLKHLNIDVEEPARITDLTPLEGMELETLRFREDDVTRGMEVVRSMKSLKKINQTESAEFWKHYDKCRTVREKVHQSGLEFARLGVDEDGTCALWFEGDQIVDLTPLRELPVTALFIRNSKVTDLLPLAGSRLEILSIGSSLLTDLSPLKGLPLRDLSISSDGLSDLSPLREMKLQGLRLRCPKVVDLSAIRSMPINSLDITGCGVTDLGIVEGMPLEFIHFDPARITKGLVVLRGMKTLHQINRQDVKDFVNGNDKPEAGKKAK